jgi:hypothetical protein
MGALPMARIAATLCAIVALATAACSNTALQPHPSDETARALVQTLASNAMNEDWAALCAMSDASCEKQLDRLGARDTVPSAAPVVLGTADVPDSTQGGGRVQGGRRVDLCGLDAVGNPYRSSILIFGPDDHPTVISPIYWVSGGYSGANIAPAPTPEPDSRCPAGP